MDLKCGIYHHHEVARQGWLVATVLTRLLILSPLPLPGPHPVGDCRDGVHHGGDRHGTLQLQVRGEGGRMSQPLKEALIKAWAIACMLTWILSSQLHTNGHPPSLSPHPPRSYSESQTIAWESGSVTNEIQAGLLASGGAGSGTNASSFNGIQAYCSLELSGTCTALYSGMYGSTLVMRYGQLLGWGNSTEGLINLRPTIKALEGAFAQTC